jgi:hypothetical protein
MFTCTVCRKNHDDSAIAFDCPFPVYLDAIPEKERLHRCLLRPDLCVLDKEHFFIKGNLDIPVTGRSQSLVFNGWTSLSKENFQRAVDLWETAGRESEPPYFGWFSNRLPGFPDTVNLKARVHISKKGQRPRIELEPTEHPLAVAQHHGISQEEYELIVSRLLHGE